jgi:hypothetical protein
MIRREKLLEICAESPASGARFVGRVELGVVSAKNKSLSARKQN